MKVFLIIIAVLFVITFLILSLSAELTVIFENGWTTRVRVLFIERDIELSKLLSFILFPERAAEQVAEERKEERKKKAESDSTPKVEPKKAVDEKQTVPKTEETPQSKPVEENNIPAKKQNKNPIQKILDDDGVLGILLLVSNLLQTANSAITTLIKGLHIYSLYVKMIIGGGDAADIGEMYGTVCGFYYPVKGVILNGMRVDQYDDYVMPDFIAPRSEYGFQFIGSINIALLFKVLFSAGKVFIVNLIKNK